MAHTIDFTSPSHPCYGLDCSECETCIFDEDLFVEKDRKDYSMESNECKYCSSLIKNYIGDDKIQFEACCGRSLVDYNSYTKPKTIMAKCGPMLSIITPSWCPKKRGVIKESIQYRGEEEKEEEKPKAIKDLSYFEKKELLMKLPKHLQWDEIEEGEIYVIPKILSQDRKVVRVVVKSDNLIRYSEIDEYGEEGRALTSIFPRDIDTIFITKLLKF